MIPGITYERHFSLIYRSARRWAWRFRTQINSKSHKHPTKWSTSFDGKIGLDRLCFMVIRYRQPRRHYPCQKIQTVCQNWVLIGRSWLFLVLSMSIVQSLLRSPRWHTGWNRRNQISSLFHYAKYMQRVGVDEILLLYCRKRRWIVDRGRIQGSRGFDSDCRGDETGQSGMRNAYIDLITF